MAEIYEEFFPLYNRNRTDQSPAAIDDEYFDNSINKSKVLLSDILNFQRSTQRSCSPTDEEELALFDNENKDTEYAKSPSANQEKNLIQLIDQSNKPAKTSTTYTRDVEQTAKLLLSYKFASYENAKIHYLHEPKDMKLPSLRREECYICKKSVLRKNFKAHKNTHLLIREKKHTCECGKTYYYLKDLRRHKTLAHGYTQ